jgi:hypothetical protein
LVPEANRYLRITPDMGHDHPSGWRPREIAVFFNSIFRAGIPLAKIAGYEERDSAMVFHYESSLSLKRADFYYSNDTTNINAERTWGSTGGHIGQDEIEIRMPREGFIYGFLFVTDIMDRSVSSQLTVH